MRKQNADLKEGECRESRVAMIAATNGAAETVGGVNSAPRSTSRKDGKIFARLFASVGIGKPRLDLPLTNHQCKVFCGDHRSEGDI